MQHATALSFLLLVFGSYLNQVNQIVQCNGGVSAPPSRLIEVAKGQVDYILGNNPLKMSYMVGYGNKFPQRIHHRGSSLPSLNQHPGRIACKDGSLYYQSEGPNPNILTGAIVGGPNELDAFADDRELPSQSEPITYTNAPLVGLLAYFNAHG